MSDPAVVETYTELTPGTGGSKMGEIQVTQADGTVVKYTRVVQSFSDRSVVSREAIPGGNSASAVHDQLVFGELRKVNRHLKRIAKLLKRGLEEG